MPFESYLIAWSVYFVSALGAYFVFWKMTAEWKNDDVVSVLRVIALVLVFMPWHAWDDQPYMAPASLVFLFDLFINKAESGIRAALPLSVACFTGMLLLIGEKYYKKYTASVASTEQ